MCATSLENPVVEEVSEVAVADPDETPRRPRITVDVTVNTSYHELPEMSTSPTHRPEGVGVQTLSSSCRGEENTGGPQQQSYPVLPLTQTDCCYPCNSKHDEASSGTPPPERLPRPTPAQHDQSTTLTGADAAKKRGVLAPPPDVSPTLRMFLETEAVLYRGAIPPTIKHRSLRDPAAAFASAATDDHSKLSLSADEVFSRAVHPAAQTKNSLHHVQRGSPTMEFWNNLLAVQQFPHLLSTAGGEGSSFATGLGTLVFMADDEGHACPMLIGGQHRQSSQHTEKTGSSRHATHEDEDHHHTSSSPVACDTKEKDGPSHAHLLPVQVEDDRDSVKSAAHTSDTASSSRGRDVTSEARKKKHRSSKQRDQDDPPSRTYASRFFASQVTSFPVDPRGVRHAEADQASPPPIAARRVSNRHLQSPSHATAAAPVPLLLRPDLATPQWNEKLDDAAITPEEAAGIVTAWVGESRSPASNRRGTKTPTRRTPDHTQEDDAVWMEPPVRVMTHATADDVADLVVARPAPSIIPNAAAPSSPPHQPPLATTDQGSVVVETAKGLPFLLQRVALLPAPARNSKPYNTNTACLPEHLHLTPLHDVTPSPIQRPVGLRRRRPQRSLSSSITSRASADQRRPRKTGQRRPRSPSPSVSDPSVETPRGRRHHRRAASPQTRKDRAVSQQPRNTSPQGRHKARRTRKTSSTASFSLDRSTRSNEPAYSETRAMIRCAVSPRRGVKARCRTCGGRRGEAEDGAKKHAVGTPTSSSGDPDDAAGVLQRQPSVAASTAAAAASSGRFCLCC